MMEEEEELAIKVDCLMVGPTGSGKTILLKRLTAGASAVDITSSSVPTSGTTLKKIGGVVVREAGGSVAPLWSHFTKGITKMIFVVDASNLCQIAAAGVQLYSMLALPTMQSVKVLVVLSKMDSSYRQMRNETLLMLKLDQLMKQVPQRISIVEASSFNSEGIDEILKWISSK